MASLLEKSFSEASTCYIYRMIRRRFTSLWFMAMMCALFSAVLRDGAPAAQHTTIQGTLVVEPEKRPALQTKEKLVPLASADINLVATLSDSRVSGREMKLEGKFRDDGVFEVHRIFVVRAGALYRLIYFCEICNIVTFGPGDCVCCQAPVEPIEVSPTDPRIYQEPDKH